LTRSPTPYPKPPSRINSRFVHRQRAEISRHLVHTECVRPSSSLLQQIRSLTLFLHLRRDLRRNLRLPSQFRLNSSFLTCSLASCSPPPADPMYDPHTIYRHGSLATFAEFQESGSKRLLPDHQLANHSNLHPETEQITI